MGILRYLPFFRLFGVLLGISIGMLFSSQASPPPVYLWAWERPEDLRFLPKGQAGVAYLAKTVVIQGNQVTSQPRHQVLRVNPGTPLIAVVRIEHPLSKTKTDFTQLSLRQAVVRAIWPVAPGGSQIPELQIDFDARQEERVFYQQLLHDLKDTLPPKTKLSMTALASWCLGDPWVANLPVSRIVPMVFDMGRDTQTVLSALEQGNPFSTPLCNTSLGLAVNEPSQAAGLAWKVRQAKQPTLFIFSRHPWTQSVWQQFQHAITKEIHPHD